VNEPAERTLAALPPATQAAIRASGAISRITCLKALE
jgi:hypothetical protein